MYHKHQSNLVAWNKRNLFSDHSRGQKSNCRQGTLPLKPRGRPHLHLLLRPASPWLLAASPQSLPSRGILSACLFGASLFHVSLVEILVIIQDDPHRPLSQIRSQSQILRMRMETYPLGAASQPTTISKEQNDLLLWFNRYVQLFVASGTAAQQAALCFTISQSLLKLRSIRAGQVAYYVKNLSAKQETWEMQV